MSATAGESAVDRDVCWEQINRAGHPFRFTRLFAGQDLDRLLALYALAAALERLVTEASDSEVAYRKLEWWRFQCLQQDLQSSKHPVIRYLVSTGAAESLNADALAALLDSVEIRLAAEPFRDIDRLFEFCTILSRRHADLESAVFRRPVSNVSPAAGLAQLVRESLGTAGENGFWWIPMNTLARHGLNRAELMDETRASEARLLFAEVLARLKSVENPEQAGSAMLHWDLVQHAGSCQLVRLAATEPRSFRAELNRLRVGDFLSLWRKARELKRSTLRAHPY